jgi:23S rRNA (cytidine1920-2'-O)/16S rRNA (cytidine1409-2'-O)-methyltransferase
MEKRFVSRAGEKLAFALEKFTTQIDGFVCADFGCSTGGFTDCMLKNGADKVFSVDTGYGVLEYKLRIDPRVVVMERTNAMHVILPEKCDLITIDAGWTRQENILPNAIKNLKENGIIISLIKPHYEAEKRMITKGLLEEQFIDEVIDKVKKTINSLELKINGWELSPIIGEKGKNKEFLALLSRI